MRDERFERVAFAAGGAGLVVLVVLLAALGVTALVWPEQTQPFRAGLFYGWLSGFTLWWGVPLGAAGWLMVHHLTGGRWGWSIRPLLEPAAATVPLLVLLWWPVLLGLGWLYPWANESWVHGNEALTWRQPYTNEPFWIGRAALYFGLWIGGGLWLAIGSRRHRERGGGVAPYRLQALSAVGLTVWGLTMTFAGIDWLGTLPVHWYSTVWGLYLMVGQATTALALAIVVLCVFKLRGPLARHVNQEVMRDLGNLLLTVIVLHTYMSYSQYFISWMGNKPAEVVWYVNRLTSGSPAPSDRPFGLPWVYVAYALMGLHFFLPFWALLFRYVKHSPLWLLVVAGGVVIARVLDALWFVVPAMKDPWEPIGLALALGIMLAMGAVWLGAFALALRRQQGLAPVPPAVRVGQSEETGAPAHG